MKSRINELIEAEDAIMSNFDHEINYEIAEVLKDGKYYAQYAGWNFCGYVYWDISKQEFICEVWTYNSIREIIKGKTLELIMKKVCKEYGSA